MRLVAERFSGGTDDTLGLLFIDGHFACFTLEDEFREVKVPGETCIPVGTYDVELRTVGGLTQKYQQMFPHIHKGMLWLRAVPNFRWIYIHVGNRDEHTDGCILVGDTCQQNVTEDGFVGGSRSAYERIYPPIAAAILRGERVTIEVKDSLEEA